jgi:hypothetical protein
MKKSVVALSLASSTCAGELDDGEVLNNNDEEPSDRKIHG